MVILVPLLLLIIASTVIGIMTAVSASRYPEWALQQTGSNKFIWVGLPIILIFFCWIGAGVMGIIWFSSKPTRSRPRRHAAARPPATANPASTATGHPATARRHREPGDRRPRDGPRRRPAREPPAAQPWPPPGPPPSSPPAPPEPPQ